MKSKTPIYIIILLCLCGTSPAQKKDTTVVRNVTVEREYRPIIQNAGKIYSLPNILSPSIKKIIPQYSEFNYPLQTDYNIHLLQPAQPESSKAISNNQGYATAGIGNYMNTVLRAGLPIISTSDMLLDGSFDHLGTFSTMKHSITSVKLKFNKMFASTIFTTNLGIENVYYNYYGSYFLGDTLHQTSLSQLKSITGNSSFTEKNGNGTLQEKMSSLYKLPSDTSNTCWRINTVFDLKSRPTNGEEFGYHANIAYKRFYSKQSYTEHLFDGNLELTGRVKKNKWGIVTNLSNIVYDANSTKVNTIPVSNLVVGINPYYQITNTEWDIRLGAKSSFSFAEGTFFNPTLDMHAEWYAVPSYLSVYGGVFGNYKINTMYDNYYENRYLSSNVKIENTYSPSILELGLKLKPVENLLIDLYAQTENIRNQYFYTNQYFSLTTPLNSDTTFYTNRFNVIYTEVTHTKLGYRLSYQYKNLVNAELKGMYNSWSTENQTHAWYMPRWETSILCALAINDYWNLSSQIFYDTDRYALLGTRAIKLNNRLDINLSIKYQLNKEITAFLNINNISNSKYEHFLGYKNQQANILLGGSISF